MRSCVSTDHGNCDVSIGVRLLLRYPLVSVDGIWTPILVMNHRWKQHATSWASQRGDFGVSPMLHSMLRVMPYFFYAMFSFYIKLNTFKRLVIWIAESKWLKTNQAAIWCGNGLTFGGKRKISKRPSFHSVLCLSCSPRKISAQVSKFWAPHCVIASQIQNYTKFTYKSNIV